MLDIATRAGFSKRTVYLEYASKDELFATICEEGLDLLLAGLHGAVDEHISPIITLKKLGEAYLTFWQTHQAYFELVFIRLNDDILSQVGDALKQRIRYKEQEGIEVIARVIERAKGDGWVRRDLDSARLAVVAWMSLTGVLTVHVNARRVELAGATVEELYWRGFSLLLRGASHREPSDSSLTKS
jgi:AcrR family transcriptional regulator